MTAAPVSDETRVVVPGSDERKPFLTPQLGLGLRALRPAWRAAFGRATRREDALAGLRAAGLSLALALLVAHHATLSVAAAVTAVVLGSALIALIGGTTLGLSGPGLAMVVVLARIGQEYGAAGLALACLVCGLAQLAVGVLGLGRFARLAPLGVVHGFVAGLGVLLIVQCLPHVLGLAAPADVHSSRVLDSIVGRIGGTRLAAIALAALACALTLLGARYARRAPAALLALAVCTGLAVAAHLGVPRLADRPLAVAALATPHLPAAGVAQFVTATLMLFALTTLETLLSATAKEQRVPGVHADLDQELIGHGVANLVLALLGGLPVAGSFVRARALRVAGGRTRGAALAHAVAAAALAPIVLLGGHHVPLAALAGVVIAYAAPLLGLAPLRAVWRGSRAQAAVLVLTTVFLVFADLLDAVEAGLVLTLVVAMVRIARARATLHRGVDGAPHQVTISGPLTFLAVPTLETLRERLAAVDPTAGVILDVRDVLVMDLTGREHFLALVGELVDRGGRVAVLGVSPSCSEPLRAADRRGLLPERLAVSERDVDRILGRAGAFAMRAQVIASVQRFRAEVREHYSPLFEELAEGQHPHTLFITCVDSRIVPVHLTGSHPGEVFIIRCLGAMVAPPGEDSLPSEGAAVEYAVGVLGVRNIVVCGHSGCGAVKAVKTAHVPAGLGSLAQWLEYARATAGDVSSAADVDTAVRTITVRQLENLRRFPLIADRLATGQLTLHAWFYDVGPAELYEWSDAAQTFVVLGAAGPATIGAPHAP